MKPSAKPKVVSKVILAIMAILARVRLLRPARAIEYPSLSGRGSADAIRKHMERACVGDQAYLAKSSLPAGPQVFHLSGRGAQFIGVSKTWADALTPGTAALWLSISSFECQPSFSVLTSNERNALLQRFAPGADVSKIPGTFVLRTFSITGPEGMSATEAHLHYWLAELRPTNQLVKRVNVILQHLERCEPFSELMQLGLFGITVVLPTQAAKDSFEKHAFPIELDALVLEELQDLVACSK